MSVSEIAHPADADFLADVVQATWASEMAARGVVPADAPDGDADEHVIAIDADCPSCGWPERTFDTATRHFGCIKCPYTSDERNA